MYFLKFSFTKQTTLCLTNIYVQHTNSGPSYVWHGRAGPWSARGAERFSPRAELQRGRRRSPQRAAPARIPERLVQKGMKRARNPAGGAGEDAGPCRAGEQAQGCRVATATGALFVHSGSSCLLPPGSAAPSRRGHRAASAASFGTELAPWGRVCAWRQQVLLKEKGCHLKQ